MASAIENQEPILEKEIRFMGPAKQEFDSLNDQANYFLDTYWPNWKNYNEPQSYILPPVFKYKHPEVSNEAFEDFQKIQASTDARNPHEVVTDRTTDEAEYIVYNAIQQLIDEKVQAPFIAVHNLDLRLNFDSNQQVHGSLTQIFPNLQWKKFQEIMEMAKGKKTPNAEFDFVLIGPKVGIIAIEVKSSSFNRERHFKDRNKNLPEDYKEGIAQLQAANALICLLEESTEISMANDACVQKILFTPNLKRARFDKWIDSLSTAGQAAVKEKLHEVKQWFIEDINNAEKELAKPLYIKLLEVLESGKRNISRETFQAYCPIIAGIASTTLLSNGSSTSSTVEMNKFDFSAFEAGLKEHSRIANQNPLENPSSKLATCSILKRASKETKTSCNVIFLSPDQQKAMQGPRKQLICGAAGTGKTIVLQSKAIECLRKGESVVVLAQLCYIKRYEMFFESSGFEKYKTYDWESVSATITAADFDCDAVLLSMSDDNSSNRIAPGDKNISISNNLEWLVNSDNVFIDDALDKAIIQNQPANQSAYQQSNQALTAILEITRLAQKFRPSKVVWVGLDPYTDCDNYGIMVNRVLTHWIGSDTKRKDGERVLATLQQVMRCSENIIRAAYDNIIRAAYDKDTSSPGLFSPVSGHKILGFPVKTIRKHLPGYTHFYEAKLVLWAKIKPIINQLSQQQVFDLKDLAIVVVNDEISDKHFYDYLIEQCKLDFPSLQSGIKFWNETSSLEWPADICVTCVYEKSSGEIPAHTISFINYQRYRGRSRATAILVDVFLSFDDDKMIAREIKKRGKKKK